MKFSKTLNSNEIPNIIAGKVTSYFTQLGYEKLGLTPVLEFKRGSLSGTLFSSSPKKWKTLVQIEIKSGSDNNTAVKVLLKVNTTGQMIVPEEIRFFEKELDGLGREINNEEYQANIPKFIETDIRIRIKIENQIKGAANWFFLISVLSLINSIIFFTGGNFMFLVGLGVTQLLNGLALAIASEAGSEIGAVAKLIVLIVNLFIAGMFVFFGVFARRKARWSFFIGTILYAFDALIFLLGPDYLSIGFHIFVLIGLSTGFMAIWRLKRIDQTS